MSRSFVQANPDFFFNGTGPYPGSSAFDQALHYYKNQLMSAESPSNSGLPALAASEKADRPAQEYQTPAYAPDGMGVDQNQAMFGNLMAGQGASREAGRAATSNVNLGSVGGAANVGDEYAKSMTDAIQANMALNKAQGSQGSSVMGDITGGLEMAGGIASEFVAPGNPIGISMAAGGAGQIAGSNGQGQLGQGLSSLGSFGSLMGGGGASGAAGPSSATMGQSGASAFTPIGNNSFSPNSLPPWLDPSYSAGNPSPSNFNYEPQAQISAFGPEFGDSSSMGLFSKLFGGTAY